MYVYILEHATPSVFHLFSISPPISLSSSLPPTAPAAPLYIDYIDVGPHSVIAVWKLSPNDGGSPVQRVQVFYRTTDQDWDSAAVKASVTEVLVENAAEHDSEMSVKIVGLESSSQCQLRVVASNHFHSSAPRDSALFNTPPPGHPGSPSHVTVSNLTYSSAVVTWVPSEIGQPFRSYEVLAAREGEDLPNEELVVVVKFEDVREVASGMEAAKVRWCLVLYSCWSLVCLHCVYIY